MQSSKSHTLLLDLDGTLIDMSAPKPIFYARLLYSLARKLTPLIGVGNIFAATKTIRSALYENISSQTLEENLCAEIKNKFAIEPSITRDILTSWATHEFSHFAPMFRPVPGADEAVRKFIQAKRMLVLATNPVVSLASIEQRLSWIGLRPNDFDLITHAGNMTRCKPDPAYYSEILKKLNLNATECTMIGNDPIMDGAAEKVGIKTHILKSWRDLEATA